MADDIDDLLDEVESHFSKQKPARTLVCPDNQVTQKPAGLKSASRTDDIDALIDDICSLEEPPAKVLTETGIQQLVASSKRCFPTFLGGSRTAKGYGTAAQQRACDRLRCVECDFRVSIFNDFEWMQDTDYLFLRNNIPDFERLKSQLLPKAGSRAYACQCKWKNVTALSDVQTEKRLKWVCGQH